MSNIVGRSHGYSFSRDGFQPIPVEYESNMAPNDATIDIPLEQVTSNGQGLRATGTATGLQTTNTNMSQTKKRAWFRGRRQKSDPYGRKKGSFGYDGEEVTVNSLGKIYRRVLNSSTIVRYFIYVLPLALIIAAPIIITATTSSTAKIGGVRVLWFFTWIEIVWLSLWVSKTVAHYLPNMFNFAAGVVSSGVRKYSQVIRKLEIPLSLVGWAVTSLVTFKPLMTRNPNWDADCRRWEQNNPQQVSRQASNPCENHYSWIGVMQKILAAALITACIYLIEKTIIQLISINYHRKQFNAKIKESKHNIWILGTLYEASRNMFPMYCNEFAEEDYIIADQLDLSRRSHSRKASNRKSGSHTPIRIIQDIGHAADKLTSAFGHVAQEVTGKQVFNPNSAHSIVVEALEKTRTSEALARRIWMSFVVEGRDALLEEDIVDVLGRDRKTEAEEAFWTFDQDQNGDISLDEFILTVNQFGRDRKSIASSMHDVDQAINVLDKMLVFVVFIIAILVFVAFLNQSFVSTLATAGTALISLSFVFSVSAQEILGSCIFLFVKHPFDIGDRVDIGTTGTLNSVPFTVEHISLLFCIFRHTQGNAVGKLCQIPNIILNTLWIENNSRSKAMTEQLTISIAFETSWDDLQILKNELTNFVTDKDNSRDFQPTVDVDVLGTSDQSNMTLLVDVKHKGNWANETVRRARRSKFMCALVSALKTVPIYPPGGGVDLAGSAALPTYTVGISHSEAKKHAEQAAQDREKARLVPNKKIEDAKSALSPVGSDPNSGGSVGAGMTEKDVRIAENMVNLTPAADPSRDDIWGRDDNSSTLADRASIDRPDIDRQSLDEVRGLLHRESTKGKRKPSTDTWQPTVPTINEPGETPYLGYPPQLAATGYENQRPGAPPSLFIPPPGPPPSQYFSEQTSSPVGQAVEMSQTSQIPPARTASNPYRPDTRSRPLARFASRESEEDEFNARPYSGV